MNVSCSAEVSGSPAPKAARHAANRNPSLMLAIDTGNDDYVAPPLEH
jgi:hypothetical protein